MNYQQHSFHNRRAADRLPERRGNVLIPCIAIVSLFAVCIWLAVKVYMVQS